MHKQKLFSYQNVIILASIFPIILFGFLSYNHAKNSKLEDTSAHIQNTNQQKKKQLQGYFKQIEFNANEIKRSILFLTKQAVASVENIQNIQKNNLLEYYNNINKSTTALSQKDIFQYVFSFLNRGKKVDDIYLSDIYDFKQDLELSNIFMVNKNGDIVYSSNRDEIVHKNLTNISDDLTKIFTDIKKRNLKKRKFKKSIISNVIYDQLSKSFKQYSICKFKDVEGYIFVELNQQKIQHIINNVSALGKTAESYLVYKKNNKTYLASNRSVKDGKVGDEKSSIYIDKGFISSGSDIKIGSTGFKELVCYMPIRINNIVFTLQTTLSYAELISINVDGIDYFQNYAKDHKFRNILLSDNTKRIFYSTDKIKNYDKKIFNDALDKVLQTKQFYITDFTFHKNYEKKVTQFALLPIIEKNNKLRTIIVIELDPAKLYKLIQATNSIYKTKETYIVGRDKKLRTDTSLKPKDFNVIESFTHNITINTKATNNISKLNTKAEIIKDYRGVNVLSSSLGFKYYDMDWIIISEIDESELMEIVENLKVSILIFIAIVTFIAFLVMLVITNLKNKQDKKLTYIATHDSLTGLPNRKLALEFLTYNLSSAKRAKSMGAVLFMDLDRFKIINDSYGHKTGDFVLKTIALRFKSILREEDMIARIGGDEFMVVVNNFHHINDISNLSKKIISTISKPIVEGDKVYDIGVSIGIATFPQDSDDPLSLIQFADTAMYKTKENGRNNYTFYSQEMTEQTLHISEVEHELSIAIKNSELELYYQPQIDLTTNKVLGVEALIRWNHPKKGLIMPNDFIPIAEDSNLILELGNWVVEEACNSFKRWKNSGVNLEYIAVNMSSKQLECSKCVEYIHDVLQRLEFDTKWLELEITESTLISNFQDTLKNINNFKNIGVRFSIDDFGTGYSSFSYLRTLNLSTLKIDREFVKDITRNRDDKAIVSAIISMGHILGYKIVGEGAESEEEVAILKELSCDLVQGFYHSKPLSEKDLLKYIKEF
jgi:diguanylate cyclase (GGDEF)-like protein